MYNTLVRITKDSPKRVPVHLKQANITPAMNIEMQGFQLLFVASLPNTKLIATKATTQHLNVES